MSKIKQMRLTDGRNRGDNFSKFELVENSCFTSSIETYHEDAHLFLRKEPAEKLCERQPHLLTAKKIATTQIETIKYPT